MNARELADTKDVAILAAAIGAGACLLVTHVRPFRSGHGVRVVRTGTLIEEARGWLSSLGTKRSFASDGGPRRLLNQP